MLGKVELLVYSIKASFISTLDLSMVSAFRPIRPRGAMTSRAITRMVSKRRPMIEKKMTLLLATQQLSLRSNLSSDFR